MDRLFLDANVLFSAAYREQAGLLELWKVSDARIVTSRYAIEEAQRNLSDDEQHSRLATLLQGTEIVDEIDPRAVEGDDQLPEKDKPILRAAVGARASHLITGDLTHFGRFFGERLRGVSIVTPSDYLRSRTKLG